METATTTTRTRKHRGLYVLFAIALLIALFRIALPEVMRTVANNRLEKESPYFSFHINDIDLHFIKGRYVVKGITGTMKSTSEKFLTIAAVESSVPWKYIFKGKIFTDVIVHTLDLTASQPLLDTAKLEMERIKEKYVKEEEKDEKKESPLILNSFAMKNSTVSVKNFMGFRENEVRTVDEINVFAKNLTPTPNKPTTDFNMTADVFGPAPLKVTGQAKIKEKPLSWDVNAVLKDFDLTTVNPVVVQKTQAIIHKGKMDLYAEAKAEGDMIEGYAKPFVSKLKMDTPPGGFKFKGAAAAAGGNLVKLLLTDSGAKTLATTAPFTKTPEKMSVEIIPILQRAVVHRAKQNIQPGLEDTIGTVGLGVESETRQAEEAE